MSDILNKSIKILLSCNCEQIFIFANLYCRGISMSKHNEKKIDDTN